MSLSTELISQFAKVTNDKSTNKKDTSVFGTIVVETIQNGDETEEVKYVRLDGSDMLIPLVSTVAALNNDRVIVTIKNHMATVTGNLTTPSTTVEHVKVVEKTITDEIETNYVKTDTLEANYTTTDELEADYVKTDTLEANYTTTEILKANYATIEKVDANYGEFDTLKTDYGVFKETYTRDLSATNASIDNLEATTADLETVTSEHITATDASIQDLRTKKLDAETAKVTYAEIADLNAATAKIDSLEADVGDINTLMFGSATGSTIQASFANAVIAQLSSAQIKSAMIESLAADKISAGDINTNNVRVVSADGKLLISDETIQISDDSRVRVQIGKDAEGDYSINIWDADGNLMFSEGGITDSAIKKAIIRNDMVSDDAAIEGKKLDIDSVITEIDNNGTKTISATKISVDAEGSTLDVSLQNLTTLEGTVRSQGTQISANTEAIKSKVWQQDTTMAKADSVTNLSTQYSALEQDVTNISATVASHTSQIKDKADASTVTAITDKVATLEQDIDGFETVVSATYATKTAVTTVNDKVDNIEIGGRNLYKRTGDFHSSYWGSYTQVEPYENDSSCKQVVCCSTYAADTVRYLLSTTTASQGFDFSDVSKTWTISAMMKGTADNQTVSITLDADRVHWYAKTIPNGSWKKMVWTFHGSKSLVTFRFTSPDASMETPIYIAQVKVEEGNKATTWTPSPEDVQADIDDVETRVATAETKITQNTESITSVATRTTIVENNFAKYSTTEQMNSAIQQTANSIASSVSATYTTKSEFGSLSVGGANLLRNSNFSNGRTNWTSIGVTVSVVTDSTFGQCLLLSASDAGSPNHRIYANTDTNFIHDSGIEYTLSFWAKASEVTTMQSNVAGSMNAVDHELSTSWQKFVKTYIASGGGSITFWPNAADVTIYLANVKLEVGNVATDWMPAFGDLATAESVSETRTLAEAVGERTTVAESLIEQLSESISMLVTDGSGTSLMTQTDTGWTFSTAEIQALVDRTSDALTDLTHEVGDVDSTVGILQQAVNDLGTIAEYVKIGTYEDEPCIELGEGDSEFKLRITNTRMMFTEGSSVLAYFNNQSLHIKKAVVEEELQQGGFVWKARSNGNLGLVWKGVTS